MNDPEFALAQLRHLYKQMVAGEVRDTRVAAQGLLGPALECLELAIALPDDADYARPPTGKLLSASPIVTRKATLAEMTQDAQSEGNYFGKAPRVCMTCAGRKTTYCGASTCTFNDCVPCPDCAPAKP